MPEDTEVCVSLRGEAVLLWGQGSHPIRLETQPSELEDPPFAEVGPSLPAPSLAYLPPSPEMAD